MLRRATHSMPLTRRSLRALSTRQVAQLETQVLEKLRSVSDGLGLGDIVSLGRVKDLHVKPENGLVACKIETSSPALMDLAQQWQKEAQFAVKKLEWVKKTKFEITKYRPRNARAGRFSSLAHVSDIIAVSSCKGGVGKSTVAVNLAFSLAKRGARVGILDADIYGPSLPTMISSSKDSTIRPSRKVKNFVEPVEYEGVKCMSFGFVNQRAAPGAGGPGHTHELVNKYNMKNVFKLPISEHFSSSVDSGRPFVLSGLSSEEENTYDSLATTVAKELVVLKHNVRLAPDMLYDKNRGIVLRLYNLNEAKEAVLHPADLRARLPTKCTVYQGNYAFAVTWSDGHTSSLYTYDALTALIAEYTSEQQ
ncbi:hypothetical protein DD238_005178 [Peronospora effusa]|uniref:Uncharacterized protein n=1 Tax=Peronospora effusa TaxID=542832 RepID=A0A3M6V816_9STRA|nr:hypothetical protein DD238_005178 [Peronospora effusa]